jgi:hypothetical protein
MFEISLVPVVVATVVAILIGMAWYSQKVFGAVWAKEADISPASQGESENMGKQVLSGAIQNFVIIYILAHFLLLAEAYPGADALIGAVWMAILVAATHVGSVIWERKSLTYFAINAGYLAVIIIVSALILTRWPWA